MEWVEWGGSVGVVGGVGVSVGGVGGVGGSVGVVGGMGGSSVGDVGGLCG